MLFKEKIDLKYHITECFAIDATWYTDVILQGQNGCCYM